MSQISQRYIQEETMQVLLADAKPGVIFYAVKPPRVERLRYDSCFIGHLMPGDVVLSVDGQAINSGDEFNARCSEGGLPRSVNVQFRRDNYYQMRCYRRAEMGGEINAFYIQIRWRHDLPLGMVIVNRDGAVVVEQADPGSIASQHFQYGDVIEKVEGIRVAHTSEAKRIIRERIEKRTCVALKVIRNVKKKNGLPLDVRFIMKKHKGFWNRNHKLEPCEDKQTEDGGGTSSDTRPNVYHVEGVAVERMALDEFGRPLIGTPARAGGTRGDTDAGTSSTTTGGG
uniref:PDZ domain-containing protein n=1 Tax=Meloidogyne enterolobii TaxID=390850 RepID=A0A6V7TRC9_MELEN|nr:unnamed protein product [Meloidogyne enterolobii]